jgi:hypothetical protein
VSAGARAHASACRACGDELRERESLRALVGGLGKVGAPADFEFRLRARMAGAKNDRGRGRFSGARWLYGFAPVAVAACFVVVSATLYFRQAPRPQTAGAPAVATPPTLNAEPDRAPSVGKQSAPAEPADSTGEVAEVNLPPVASPKTYKPVRRVAARAAQAGEVASKGKEGADVGQRTLVSSVTAAPILTPIKASAEPLRVIVTDERGAVRVVPMRSVSFGSQDFLSRGGATKQAPVDVGGVW